MDDKSGVHDESGGFTLHLSRRALTVIAISVGAAVIAVAAYSISRITSSAPLPEVQACSNVPGAVEIRPTLIGVGCASLSTNLTPISWTSWTPASASGTGTYNQDTCVPHCYDGVYRRSQVAISLTNPGDFLGYLVFQRITVLPLAGGTPIVDMTGAGSGWGTDKS
jgi:hypothetical protein